MSSGAGSSSGMRWPDVAVAAGCLLLVAVLGWVAVGPTSPPAASAVQVPWQLRNLHQAALIYGLDNNGYLPGLNADGSLLTNNPAERYDLLVAGNHLPPDVLVSPRDARPDAVHSYAILDLSQPGGRRDAWTTLAQPDAPILAESPASLGHDDPAAWSGWVLWHSPYLAAETAASSVQRSDSPRLRTRYRDDGPFIAEDDLFTAQGPDDAHLIAADR